METNSFLQAPAAISGQHPGLAPVRWPSRKRRFQANLDALPSLAPALRDYWESHHARYQLFLTTDGDYQITDLQAATPAQVWACGLRDHRLDRAAWTLPREPMQFVAPVTFDGAGFGWLLLHVLSQTHLTALTYSCPICLIEPDLAALAMLLHMHDLREYFLSTRLRVFAGAGAGEQFRQALRKEISWTVPQLHCSSPLFSRHSLGIQQICEEEQNFRAKEQATTKARVEAYYADKSPAYWRDPLRPGRHGRAAPARAGHHDALFHRSPAFHGRTRGCDQRRRA